MAQLWRQVHITTISVGTPGSIGFTSTSDTSKFSTSGAFFPLICHGKLGGANYGNHTKLVVYLKMIPVYSWELLYCSIIRTYIYLYYLIFSYILSCLSIDVVTMILLAHFIPTQNHTNSAETGKYPPRRCW